jgi:antirestriction protein ArdC/phage/plasmid primase-like uncharacterized protein
MSLTVEEGKDVVTAFCAVYPSAYQVQYKLRDTQEEVFNEKATIEAVGKIYGAYFPARNLAAFATSNFRDKDEFEGTLKHEILGHYGLNTCSNEEKHAILDAITAAKHQPGIGDLWQKVSQHYPGEPDQKIAEEVFAFACEEVDSHTLNNSSAGEDVLKECLTRSAVLDHAGLKQLTQFIAGGLQDGSRQQQIFPLSDNEQFKKETKMAQKKPFHEAVAEKLIEQLKAGTAPWQRPWEPGDPNGGMPINPTTGNRYKGINAIQLMSENREDNRWLTYKQASSIGAQVRKGEKGTPVQYWKFSEEQIKRGEDGKPVIGEDGKPEKEVVKLERPRVFMATVFNAEQIDGMPPLERKENSLTWDAHERAENILQSSGAKIFHSDSNRAFYRSSTDSIHLPEKAQFDSADKYYATALHELGHWTGHSSRLDRDMANPFGSEAYAKEELRAEISSMILGDELGIGHDTEQHAAYVGSWIKVLQDDPLEIFRAAADAEKIHDFVLGLENQQTLDNTLNNYNTQALDYLARNYGVNQLDEEQIEFLNRSANEGSAPVLGAIDLAEKYKLKLTEEGLAFSVTDRLTTYQDDLKKDQALTFLDAGTGEKQGQHKYLFNARDSEFKHVIGINFRANTAEVLETIHKESNQDVEPSREQFIKDILALPVTTQRSTQIDQHINSFDQNPEITAVLDVDINNVLNNPDVTFDHFRSFKGDSLESALREHGFNSIGSVTGSNPGEFNETAWERLSPVFGISPHHDDVDNEYLERKGLAQQFAIQAEEIYLAQKETLNNSMEVPAMTHRAGSQENPNSIVVKPVESAPGQYQVFSSDGDELSIPFNSEAEAIEEKGRLMAEDRFVEGFKAKQYDDWLDSDANQAFGFELPHDWNGVTAIRGNIEVQDEAGNLNVEPAAEGNAQFYSLYAQVEDGTHTWLQDYDEFDHAIQVKDRLDLAAANIEENEFEQAAMIARVHEERIRRDPNSTDEDILAAKEMRKDAEMTAMLNDQELQKRIKEEEQRIGSQEPNQNTYINVPFKEKEDAKGLGAKWDRQQQSWYVPAGVELAPFAKWQSSQSESIKLDIKPDADSGKTFLAVPYGERGLAKSAGALWDKSAKSWFVGPQGDMDKLQRWLPDNVPSQQGPALTPSEEFAEALKAMNFVVSGEHPIMDGKPQRIKTQDDKPGQLSGFYVGHTDGHPAGYIKDNRTGKDMRWKSKGYALSDDEKAKLNAEAATKKAERAEEQTRTYEATAKRLDAQIKTLGPVTTPTPYMANKGIEIHSGALTNTEGKTTFIPAQDTDGKLWTVQYINEDGSKRFAKNSKKEGCFHVVGGMDALSKAPALVVGEGYATASTASEALGFATVAAFDSGNLPAVVEALHEKFPDKPVVVIGDDDRHLEMTQGNNPGREKAESAAKSVGGKAVFPVFSSKETDYPTDLQPITPKAHRNKELSEDQTAALDRIKRFTDFNDMAGKSELGMEGVKRQLSAAVSLAIKKTPSIDQEEARTQKQEEVITKKRSARIG